MKQIFRRTIKMDTMEITKAEKKMSLQHLRNLLYSRSEEEYFDRYSKFCKEAPLNVVNYYNDNWHMIKDEWVRCYLCASNFNNDTNNRIESLNQKLKLFIEKFSYLTNFLEELFIFIRVHQTERDILSRNIVLLHPAFQLSSDEEKYRSLLTNFAFDYVSTQIEKMDLVKWYVTKITDKVYAVKSVSSEKIKYTVTPTTCTCVNMKSMGLPCRHIFKIRSIEKEPLYNAAFCKERWTKEYFVKYNRLWAEENIDRNDFMCTNVVKCETVTSGALLAENSVGVEKCSKLKTASIEEPSKLHFQNVDFDLSIDTRNVLQDQVITVKNLQNEDLQLIDKTHVPVDQSISVKKSQNEDVLLTIDKTHVPEDQSICVNELQNKVSQSNIVKTNKVEDPSINVENVVLQPLNSKRGRPKGSDLNAIGLLKKSKRFNCIEFNKLSNFQKAYIILQWIVHDKCLNEKTLGCDLIDVKDLNIREGMPCWIYNPEVDIVILEKFVVKEAYLLLCSCFIKSKNNVQWICSHCNIDLYADKSISCDHCLLWMHYKCEGIKKTPPLNALYFCKACKVL